MSTLIRPQTSDVFATCYHKSGGENSYYVEENALVYVGAGRLEVMNDGEPMASFEKGEYYPVSDDDTIKMYF